MRSDANPGKTGEQHAPSSVPPDPRVRAARRLGRGRAGPAHARVAEDSPRKVAAAGVLIDDFEADSRGWKFIGGEEFPGAKGSSARDTGRAGGGKSSYRLDADFRGGGAYVGSWKDLETLALPDIEEFQLRVRARNLRRLGVRLVDETGQCHQGSVELPTAGADGWGEVVLKVRGLVGGEHWGGAGDGAWHGPPKGLGLNIGAAAAAGLSASARG